MWKNYFKTALRNLRRRKGYAFLNIMGLAVGIACCLLILFFVRDELSYDRFHEKAERIYRIVSEWDNFSVPATNPPFVRALRGEHPDFEIAQILPFEGLVQRGERSFREERLFFANPDFFEVFTFPLRRGDARTALTEPYTVVLTEAMAEKYFSGEDPLGKTLQIDDQFEAEVTGVAENVPTNSHFHFDFLVSWATLDALYDYSNSTNWGNNSIYTYLLLPEGYAPETMEEQLPGIVERHAGEDWNGALLSLQALTDIHLHSHHNMELEANSRAAYVYIFSAIALFILLLACINFMNLSTAQSAERAKEVGVRKTVGAERRQLIGQFMTESVLLSFFALFLAVVLVAFVLPAFRALSGKALSLGVLTDGFTLLALVGIALVAGLLAGSYPALALSGFQPVATLRGQFQSGIKGRALRKGLVVFQFAVSIALVVGTAVVYSQLNYLRAASLGFDKEQVVVIPTQINPSQSEQLNAQYPAFKETLLQQPGVESVTISSERLPSELLDGSGITLASAPESAFEEDLFVPTRLVSVGHDFFEVLGVNMTHGRSFSLDFPSDSSAFILNETAARMLQEKFPEQIPSLEAAVGEELQLGNQQGPLVGIAEDFNMSSLHEAIEPIIFHFQPSFYEAYLVRVQGENLSATMDALRGVWVRFYPDRPFQFSFTDQAFDAQYRAEERLMQIFAAFAGLAILIACLGLFGLAAFAAERRTKEIGIRKVLGASVGSIVALLSKDFLKLVGLAFLVAAPIAYYAMHRWLEGFAYRIDIGLGVFLLAGLLAMVIAFLTVSYQSVRAALKDPVKSLRYE